MQEYWEIEITNAKGEKFYEISSSLKDSWDLCRLHKGVAFHTVERGEK